MQAVQKPGEAIYLPFGMPHTILNLEDNVAVTENHLFVDGVPGSADFWIVYQSKYLDDLEVYF